MARHQSDRITLVKELWDVPKELPFHHDALVPFRAGGTISWRLL
jgi:dihydroorotase